MWWLAIAALLFTVWFCWQLFGPNPPIIVSKETTFITEPLRADGLPDYRKYVLDKLRDGVTHENNAAVLMWQALGPGRGDVAISPTDWQLICSELNIPATADPSTYLIAPDSRENCEQVDAWLRGNSTDWKPSPTEDPRALNELGMSQAQLDGDRVIADAMYAPWRREQLLPLAKWVDANRAPLDLLVEASDRSRFYSPFSTTAGSAKNTLLAGMPFYGIMHSRTAARALMVRAMLHLGENRPEEAWQGMLAVHRWARLIGQGPTIIEQLVAIAIDGIACSGTASLLSSNDLTPELARQIQRDLNALRPTAHMADAFGYGERLYFLDAVIAGSGQGIGSFLQDSTVYDDTEKTKFQPLDYISADWNTTLAKGNQWYDRLSATCRLPTHAARKKEFDRVAAEIQNLESQLHRPTNGAAGALSPSIRSEMLSAAVIALLSPAFNSCSSSEDRAKTQLYLVQLAAALAVYRAEHGDYPDKLDELVPNVIPKLPVDLYHAKQFVYKRDADGYLLYSTGENGIDDGGSHKDWDVLAGRNLDDLTKAETEAARKKIPAGADDLSIRVPRPVFKLPSPPAKR